MQFFWAERDWKLVHAMVAVMTRVGSLRISVQVILG